MSDKIYLLAYPRSGSTLARIFISILTERRPTQTTGTLEAPTERYLKEIIPEFTDEFIKYHLYYAEGQDPIQLQETILHLVRDPLENIVSWTFSRLNPRDVSDIIQAEDFILSSHQELLDNLGFYRANQIFFGSHEGDKVVINYEEMLTNPQHLIEQLQTVTEVKSRQVEYYKTNFEKIKKDVMALRYVPGSPGEEFRINTFGNLTYWRETLSLAAINRFNELYQKARPKFVGNHLGTVR